MEYMRSEFCETLERERKRQRNGQKERKIERDTRRKRHKKQ
jgi:hypothetical protein